MTPAERRDPRLLNGRRRRRIAAGSGTTVPEINRLVKQFEQMQQLMRQAAAAGRGGKGGKAGKGGKKSGKGRKGAQRAAMQAQAAALGGARWSGRTASRAGCDAGSRARRVRGTQRPRPAAPSAGDGDR
jgi:signal recognition particle subunit SRP54